MGLFTGCMLFLLPDQQHKAVNVQYSNILLYIDWNQLKKISHPHIELRTVTTFIVSQSTCFLMWIKLVVGHQLRSHSCPIFMRRQFPMSDSRLSSAWIQTNTKEYLTPALRLQKHKPELHNSCSTIINHVFCSVKSTSESSHKVNDQIVIYSVVDNQSSTLHRTNKDKTLPDNFTTDIWHG